MIKSWNKFFESNEGEFTEEMAQEIIYTFGEDSRGYSNDDPQLKDFLRSEEVWNGISFYETGYDEMKQLTHQLLKNAEKTPEIKSECIRVYNYIREQNKIFPEIYQIEDICLQLIEKYNLNFDIDVNMGKEYLILLRLWENDLKLDFFLSVCDEIKKIANRLSSNKYNTEVSKCRFEVYSHSSEFQFGIRLSRLRYHQTH